MADRVSAEVRSSIMSRIKAKNTTPEICVFAAMRACGWSFNTHDSHVIGTPDVTFPVPKVAMFIDGDFWHGYRFPQWRDLIPPFWQQKIEHTRRRDRRVRDKLRRRGWTVLRVWEHDIEKDILACLSRIAIAAHLTSVKHSRVTEALKALPPLRHRRKLPRRRTADKNGIG